LVPTQPFGKTGHLSTKVVFGAAALWDTTQEKANDALDFVLRSGVNHIDVAASYGKAQELLGPWLPARRDAFFLATKTEKRGYDEAMRDLEASLKLLKTDHIDLWQMHCLIDEAEWEKAMSKDGALTAFQKAKDEGVVGFLGVTGHGHGAPAMHLRSLERFPFDSVLLPWNWILSRNAEYRASVEKLSSACGDRGVAMQLIKVFCRRPWGEREKTHTTWYEPYAERADIEMALNWAASFPNAFICSPGDLRVMPLVMEAAQRMGGRPSDAEMAEFARRTEMADLF
jgi:aryl-alcohol dehydrogenase-like predicted oxidoreductase